MEKYTKMECSMVPVSHLFSARNVNILIKIGLYYYSIYRSRLKVFLKNKSINKKKKQGLISSVNRKGF